MYSVEYATASRACLTESGRPLPGSARDNFRRIVSQMLFERVLHRVGATKLLPIVILHRVREAGPSIEPFQVLTVVQLAVSKVSG